jgi:hypothetical protein
MVVGFTGISQLSACILKRKHMVDLQVFDPYVHAPGSMLTKEW